MVFPFQGPRLELDKIWNFKHKIKKAKCLKKQKNKKKNSCYPPSLLVARSYTKDWTVLQRLCATRLCSLVHGPGIVSQTRFFLISWKETHTNVSECKHDKWCLSTPIVWHGGTTVSIVVWGEGRGGGRPMVKNNNKALCFFFSAQYLSHFIIKINTPGDSKI